MALFYQSPAREQQFSNLAAKNSPFSTKFFQHLYIFDYWLGSPEFWTQELNFFCGFIYGLMVPTPQAAIFKSRGRKIHHFPRNSSNFYTYLIIG